MFSRNRQGLCMFPCHITKVGGIRTGAISLAVFRDGNTFALGFTCKISDINFSLSSFLSVIFKTQIRLYAVRDDVNIIKS